MIKLNKQKFNNACVIFQIDFMETQNKHNENEFSSNIENSTKMKFIAQSSQNII